LGPLVRFRAKSVVLSESCSEAGSFDVLELAAATAELLASPSCRDSWLLGRELERWLVGEGIARPNGAVGRLELTEHRVELVSLYFWATAPPADGDRRRVAS
jgi:hypothetical protein